MTYTSNKILNNVSYSHKVDFLTTEKLVGFKMKSWQVFKQKVGRFYPKNRPPPLIQKFIAGLRARLGIVRARQGTIRTGLGIVRARQSTVRED